ncbi:hypothetical protein SK128_025764 [Halocaridina rubra]|uniref:ETS domain-containing protein n=1 Tax=Halocaridina rubra TaxID=373956 RepID=A0AAN8X2P9_HALRR
MALYMPIQDSLFSDNHLDMYKENSDIVYFTVPDALDPYDYDPALEISDTFLQMGTLDNSNPMYWTGEDCYYWAVSICTSRCLDFDAESLQGFKNVTGDKMITYTSYDFCNHSDFVVGSTLYSEFQEVLRKQDIVISTPKPELTTFVQENEYQLPEGSDITDLSMEASLDSIDFEDLLTTANIYDQQVCDDKNLQYQDGPLYIETEDVSRSSDVDYFHRVPSSPDSQRLTPSPTSICSPASPSSNCDPSSPSPPPSPQLSSSYNSGVDIFKKITTSSRKRERGPKNWEYLMRMISDEKYNPSVIRWEDEDTYTFRIVKPTVIAQIWGKRSNKPNLSYDNFARGLRYHYKTGALKAVHEKQLVYRCGPKAINYLKNSLQNRRPR